MHGVRRVAASRFSGAAGAGASVEDAVVVEEPLAIRLGGDTLAVTMRTPGHDRELVLGFLWSEGVIRAPGDVSGLAHCGRLGVEGHDNVMEVDLAPGVRPPIDEHGELARRGTLISSACGVCGRRSIDDWMQLFPALIEATTIARSVVIRAMAALHERQPWFRQTGGCHAASLVDFAGQELATFEDVGRHNAVDKVVGARILARAIPARSSVLLVSGRASFEIVQKALAASIPVVASVSAPSSLAVDLATRGNVTLLGFVRGDRCTVYAAPERVRESE